MPASTQRAIWHLVLSQKTMQLILGEGGAGLTCLWQASGVKRAAWPPRPAGTLTVVEHVSEHTQHANAIQGEYQAIVEATEWLALLQDVTVPWPLPGGKPIAVVFGGLALLDDCAGHGVRRAATHPHDVHQCVHVNMCSAADHHHQAHMARLSGSLALQLPQRADVPHVVQHSLPHSCVRIMLHQYHKH